MAGRTRSPVAPIAAFWDSSALVPLCIDQPATVKILGLYRSFDLVVWWSAPIEVASALSRLVRMRQISSDDVAKARKIAARLEDSWYVVQPSETVRAKAVQMVGLYDLRAADSLQLAAALEWCEGKPQGRPFFTLDERLRDAAVLAGFEARSI